MRKFAISVAAAALLAGAPVLAQSVGEKTGINSALDISPTTADFVKEAAISDMLEIAGGQDRRDQGQHRGKEVRRADGHRPHQDQRGSQGTGRRAAPSRPDIPASLDSASQKKLDELKDAKADDFAGVYDPMQVSAHKDAVSLFERYAKSGENAKLKDWAGKTLPTLQHHLEMAQAMNKNRK